MIIPTTLRVAVMIPIEAPGLTPADLREALRDLSPNEGVLAPPDIDRASIELGDLLIEVVRSLPALLTAIAALWTIKASRASKRKLESISIETADAVVTVPFEELGQTSTALEIPETVQVRRLRLNLADDPD